MYNKKKIIPQNKKKIKPINIKIYLAEPRLTRKGSIFYVTSIFRPL